MSNIGSTNFNGTNGIGLRTLDSNWVQAFGSTYSMEVYNNRARGSNGSNNPTYIYNIAPPSADYSVSADFYIVGTTSTAFTAWILARQSTTADTRYAARWRNGTGWQLYKYVAGTATQLGSTVAATYTAGSTHTAKLVCDGTAISVYVDNVLTIGPITDSSITAAGYGGIRVTTDSTTDGVHLDNFSIDTLSADVTINTSLGSASAVGLAASVAAAIVIACSLGGASASGNQASISTGSNVTINCAAGTATASGHSATVTSSGSATITTDVFKNNTGTILTALTVPKLAALKLSDMTLAASWTSQTTDGSGVLSLTSGGLVAATDYLLVTSSADGLTMGTKKYTAA